jgi:hypothetical protein
MPQAQIGSRIKRITLTAAQIKALYSTPITIVAAPGSGKAIIVDKIVAKLEYATAAFTGSNNVEFRYTNASGDKVVLDLAYAALNLASGTGFTVCNKDDANVTAVANAAVIACVPSADPGGTTAAGTLTLEIFYSIIS